jgi:hypothetical protein
MDQPANPSRASVKARSPTHPIYRQKSYNYEELGWRPRSAACGLLTLARLAATRLRRRPDRAVNRGLDTLGTGLSWWLALFLVPAPAG